MSFGKIKHFAVGVAMTGLTVAVLFFFVRRLPDNIRAYFQA